MATVNLKPNCIHNMVVHGNHKNNGFVRLLGILFHRSSMRALDEKPIDVIVEYEDVWVSYITYTLNEHIVGGMFPKTMKRT